MKQPINPVSVIHAPLQRRRAIASPSPTQPPRRRSRQRRRRMASPQQSPSSQRRSQRSPKVVFHCVTGYVQQVKQLRCYSTPQGKLSPQGTSTNPGQPLQVQDLWLTQSNHGVSQFRLTNLNALMQPGHRVTVLSCTVQPLKTYFAVYNHTTRRWYARSYRQRLQMLLLQHGNSRLGAIARLLLEDFLNLAWLAILIFIWLMVFGYPVWYLLCVAILCYMPLVVYRSYRQMRVNRLARHARRLFAKVQQIS